MEIHKKLLLILTIIIASIILYRLWVKRIVIEKEVEILDKIEGFSFNGLMETKNVEYALNQYFIKASWNTAYTGTYNSKYKSNIMDISMVIDVMNSGCRFLDFEIYSTQTTIGKDTKSSLSQTVIIPVVGVSNQVSNNYQMDCNDPVVKLVDVFTAISQNSFMVQNGKDPLFVQLRVKSANIDLYKSLLSIINKNSAFGKTLNTTYSISKSTSNFNTTPLSELKGKIFLIADLVNSDPMFTNILLSGMDENSVFSNISVNQIDNTKNDYSSLITGYQSTFTTVTGLNPLVINSRPNNKTLLLPAQPYNITKDGLLDYETSCKYVNLNTFNESYPDFSIFNMSNLEKLSMYNLVINHSIHILPFRFYIDDNNLADYENIFINNGKCAFVLMGTIVSTYSNKLNKVLYV